MLTIMVQSEEQRKTGTSIGTMDPIVFQDQDTGINTQGMGI